MPRRASGKIESKFDRGRDIVDTGAAGGDRLATLVNVLLEKCWKSRSFVQDLRGLSEELYNNINNPDIACAALKELLRSAEFDRVVSGQLKALEFLIDSHVEQWTSDIDKIVSEAVESMVTTTCNESEEVITSGSGVLKCGALACRNWYIDTCRSTRSRIRLVSTTPKPSDTTPDSWNSGVTTCDNGGFQKGRRMARNRKAASITALRKQPKSRQTPSQRSMNDSAGTGSDTASDPGCVPGDGDCSVCGGGASVEEDLIVFCEDCDTAVHQSCYGVSVVPEDAWRCAICTANLRGKNISCAICGHDGGAMKRLEKPKNKWAHLLCAWWETEATIVDPVAMEPIRYGGKLSASRRKLTCQMCDSKDGACMTCFAPECNASFHAFCGHNKGSLFLEIDMGNVARQAYCLRHRKRRYGALDLIRTVASSDAASRMGRYLNKLKQMEADLAKKTVYASPDDFFKELRQVLLKASENKRVSYESAVQEVAEIINFRLPTLQRIYSDSGISADLFTQFLSVPHSILPPQPSTTKSKGRLKQALLASRDVCAICHEELLVTERTMKCTNSCPPHQQHSRCTVSKKRQSPKCGVCGSQLVTHMVADGSRDPSQGGQVGLNGARASIGNRYRKYRVDDTSSDCIKPTAEVLDFRLTEEWMQVISLYKYWGEDEAAPQIQAAIEIAEAAKDRFAKVRLKKAMHCLKSKVGPGKSILAFLLRDYNVLITRRKKLEQMKVEDMCRNSMEEEEKRQRSVEEERKKREEEMKKRQEIVNKRKMSKLLKQKIKSKSASKLMKLSGLSKTAKVVIKPKRSPTEKVKRDSKVVPSIQAYVADSGEKLRTRYVRCNRCEKCKAADCRVCMFCVDMRKYGGSGTRKRCCINRVCTDLQCVILQRKS